MYEKLLKKMKKAYDTALGGNTTDEVSKLMQTDECRSMIVYYLDEIHSAIIQNNVVPEEDIRGMLVLLDCAQLVFNYSGDETMLSDTEYDTINEYVQDVYADGTNITVPVVANKNVVTKHRYTSLRGTLDKIYYLEEPDEKAKSRKSLGDWVKSSERAIYENTRKHINLMEEEIYVFPKWDGVSVIFEYYPNGDLKRALTRGFTETNECQDITHVFRGRKGPILDSPVEYGEKTEVMMTEDDLEYLNEKFGTDYKQTRSMVSSIINSDTVDERSRFLTIMSLRLSELRDGEETLQKLSPGAFKTPFIRCKLKDIDLIQDFAEDHYYVDGLRCDGAVIYLINPEVQKALGRKDEKQKFEVAFKFTEQSTTSKIKDIEFAMGLFGSVNPVAKIKPVKLKGNTINRISLGSMDRFLSLELRYGDKVNVLYDIIPYLTLAEHKHGDLIKAPEYCPVCGDPLVWVGAELYCRNKKCPNLMKGRILNYLRKMHIDDISYATIETLYNEGFLKDITDLYKIKDNARLICQIPGFGTRKVERFVDEIESHMTVPASQVLGSLGIESLGPKRFEMILRVVPLDTLINDPDSCYLVLTDTKGIGTKFARACITGIKENKGLIKKLMNILDVIDVEAGESMFTVCFTKVRDKTMEEWVRQNGGKVVDSVTRDLTALIVPDLAVESSKVAKARKYSIPVVPIETMTTVLPSIINA